MTVYRNVRWDQPRRLVPFLELCDVRTKDFPVLKWFWDPAGTVYNLFFASLKIKLQIHTSSVLSLSAFSPRDEKIEGIERILGFYSTGCFISMGRFHIAITPVGINIFQIGLFHLKVDELAVVLIYNIKYFGQESALHHTPKNKRF